MAASINAARFQFALPRGERRGFVGVGGLAGSFNSRSREGSDFRLLGRVAAVAGFNSRSREGSDGANDLAQVINGSFNSRSREGSDFPKIKFSSLFPRFNSRSREGSDQSIKKFTVLVTVSIRAPARGATRRQRPRPGD